MRVEIRAVPVSDEQRLAALDAAVYAEVQHGAVEVGRSGFEVVVAYGVLKRRRYVLAVNPVGRVWRRWWKSQEWEQVG